MDEDAAPDPRKLDPGRLDPVRRLVATDAEVARLFARARAMPASTVRERFLRGRTLVMVGMAALAALRRTDVVLLNLADVPTADPDPRVIVRVSKGGESRWVPMPPELAQIVREWLPVRAAWCAEHGHASPALLPVDRDRRLSQNGIAACMVALAESTEGVRKALRLHGLRHNCATRIAETHGPMVAQAVLGHSDIATTLKYLHTEGAKVTAAMLGLRIPPLPAAPTPIPVTAPPSVPRPVPVHPEPPPRSVVPSVRPVVMPPTLRTPRAMAAAHSEARAGRLSRQGHRAGARTRHQPAQPEMDL